MARGVFSKDRTCPSMQKAVRFQFPHCRLARLRHEVAQEQVHGVLLLSITDGVAVEAPDRDHEVPALNARIPFPTLAMEELAVGLAASVLH